MDLSNNSPKGSTFFSWLFYGSTFIGGIVFLAAVVLYYNQEALLYHPCPQGLPKTPLDNPPGLNSPGDWTKEGKRNKFDNPGIPFEDHMIETSDGVLIHTWLLLQENSENVPTLIYFHGNAGNMGIRLQNAAHMYAFSKVNVLMMDYRGYGSSLGSPSEQGIQLDGEAVVKFAKSHPKLTNSKLLVFGRSLGGAISIWLADKFPELISGVIVENTFLSINAMVDVLMPFLKPIKPYVLKIKWESDNIIPNLKQPILFISGDSDELVPHDHMKKLYQLAKSSTHRQFYVVIGGGHNDSWDIAGLEYYLNLKKFIDTYISQIINADTESDNNPPSPLDIEQSASSSYVSLHGDSLSASEGEEDGYFLVKENDTTQIPIMEANAR